MLHFRRSVHHACGVQTAWVEETSAERAVAAVAQIDRAMVSHVVAFFSPVFDGRELVAAFSRHFPQIPVSACSTAGGISPAGRLDPGLVIIAFPKHGFRITSTLLENVSDLDVGQAAAVVRALRRSLGTAATERRPSRFALSLVDGLANSEERLVSVIDQALDGIPLVGGSAGDDLAFKRTSLIHDGKVHTDAAVLLLVEADFPIQIFRTDNFEPTETKFVVTDLDEETRTVRELNAAPAATEYAMAVGLDPRNLSPMSFASHPLVVRVGGEYFCRSIRRLNPDGSLTFFCAIDRGLVLTLARPRDGTEVARAELAHLERDLGGIDVIIGFDCVLRRLDAKAHQRHREISDLYRQYNIVGFETYGEQYRSMHLNQTFTGVAIGFPGP